jgi:hypothetical protein
MIQYTLFMTGRKYHGRGAVLPRAVHRARSGMK